MRSPTYVYAPGLLFVCPSRLSTLVPVGFLYFPWDLPELLARTRMLRESTRSSIYECIYELVPNRMLHMNTRSYKRTLTLTPHALVHARICERTPRYTHVLRRYHFALRNVQKFCIISRLYFRVLYVNCWVSYARSPRYMVSFSSLFTKQCLCSQTCCSFSFESSDVLDANQYREGLSVNAEIEGSFSGEATLVFSIVIALEVWNQAGGRGKSSISAGISS